MADISFLLIIFFMVTTVVQVDRTSVALPVSSERDEIPRAAAFVVLSTDGALRFSDGREESRELPDVQDLHDEALRLVQADPFHPFVIKADGAVLCERIDAVLDALRRAQARSVFLLTGQEAEGGT